MKKVLLTTVMSLMMCMGVFAQDYLNAPKPYEKVLGVISIDRIRCIDGRTNGETGFINGKIIDWYKSLLEKAQRQYPNKVIDIRKMEVGTNCGGNYTHLYYGPAVGQVVDVQTPEAQANNSLSQAINKALRNVREGSRMAIDQISVTSNMDRSTLKDQLIDMLLDKGYKVVAKEYLEKLYEEQQAQQSGIYNDRTTVQENNFSAVGYFVNVKATETYIRIQVVNVSTGEYEGNATVNY